MQTLLQTLLLISNTFGGASDATGNTATKPGPPPREQDIDAASLLFYPPFCRRLDAALSEQARSKVGWPHHLCYISNGHLGSKADRQQRRCGDATARKECTRQNGRGRHARGVGQRVGPMLNMANKQQ